jgi:aryl-alcohol dehydrogenase-like predicted oxidoreductase
MLKKIIANTDIAVSSLGLGTVKFGRNQQVHYPQDFELPSDKAILDLLACAQGLGINLLDTAPAYGISEERLGPLLKGQRTQWILATKTGEEFIHGASHFDFSPQATRKSIERSLKRLGTDYLDIVLVHSNGEDKKIIEESAIFDTLAELKKSGCIRAYGMSTKTVEGGKLAVDLADIVMVTHNPAHTVEQSVIAYAHQHKKGVFIKKGLASGHLDKIAGTDPVQAAMQFIFQEPGVSSIIIGTLNAAHLAHDVHCATLALGG